MLFPARRSGPALTPMWPMVVFPSKRLAPILYPVPLPPPPPPPFPVATVKKRKTKREAADGTWLWLWVVHGRVQLSPGGALRGAVFPSFRPQASKGGGRAGGASSCLYTKVSLGHLPGPQGPPGTGMNGDWDSEREQARQPRELSDEADGARDRSPPSWVFRVASSSTSWTSEGYVFLPPSPVGVWGPALLMSWLACWRRRRGHDGGPWCLAGRSAVRCGYVDMRGYVPPSCHENSVVVATRLAAAGRRAKGGGRRGAQHEAPRRDARAPIT